MKHIHTYSQDAEPMIKGMRSFRALVRHAKNDGNIVIIPDCPLAAIFPPPCRGRAREGLETLSFYWSTPTPVWGTGLVLMDYLG